MGLAIVRQGKHSSWYAISLILFHFILLSSFSLSLYVHPAFFRVPVFFPFCALFDCLFTVEEIFCTWSRYLLYGVSPRFVGIDLLIYKSCLDVIN